MIDEKTLYMASHVIDHMKSSVATGTQPGKCPNCSEITFMPVGSNFICTSCDWASLQFDFSNLSKDEVVRNIESMLEYAKSEGMEMHFNCQWGDGTQSVFTTNVK